MGEPADNSAARPPRPARVAPDPGTGSARPVREPAGPPASSPPFAGGAGAPREAAPAPSPFDVAFAEARAAGARGEVPVGAVVAKGGVVLASAGNRTLELRDPTAHAETLAIRAACAALNSERLPGCDLYVTLEPCPMCAAAIGFARVARLYYAASDPKSGGVEHGPRVFAHPTCHHAPEVYEGFRAAEASALLSGFFRARR